LYTPLHVTAINDRPAVAERLVAKGANVNAKDEVRIATTPRARISLSSPVSQLSMLCAKPCVKGRERER
jgi:hypothetical protein